MASKPSTDRITVKLPSKTREKLRKKADQNMRSESAEAAVAITAHVTK